MTADRFNSPKLKMIRQLIFGILFGLSVHLINSNQSVYTIQIDEAKFLNSTYLEGYYNISRITVSKFNRTQFVFNADFEFLTDLNENFVYDVAIYVKRKAGQSWSKNLYNYPNYSFCDTMKKYRQYSMEDFKAVSNFPQFDKNDESCVFPKVN